MVPIKNRLYKFFNHYYPQNFIIRYPLAGTVIIGLFSFVFLALYKPFNVHASGRLNFEETMAVYSLANGLSVLLFVRILKMFRGFNNINEWTLIRDILAVLFVLAGIGIVIYLMGFVVETSAPRWNLRTFLNSFFSAFLLGIIPFTLFTAINYRFLSVNNLKSPLINGQSEPLFKPPEELLKITSQLKKEELSFYPSQFLYAESEGNYVIFYLDGGSQVRKHMLRNSISNIETQLSVIPYFIRVHRSFIVNLKKVRNKQGNILGYQLKISGSEFKIPVSRNRIKIFDKLFARFHNA